MQKTWIKLSVMGPLSLIATIGFSWGCKARTSGGDLPDFQFPSRLRVTYTVGRQYTEDLTVSWRGQHIASLEIETGEGAVGGSDHASGNWSPSPPPSVGDYHQFGLTSGLTAGLWRFEFIMSGDGRQLRLICDQEITASDSQDTPQIMEMTFSEGGADSVGLKAVSYVTDFTSYPIGGQPSDWTTFGATVGSAWSVQSGGAIGGKLLAGEQTVDGLRVIGWDASPPTEDVEVLTRIRVHATDPEKASPIIVLRGQEVPGGGHTGYFVGLVGGSHIEIGKFETSMGEPLETLSEDFFADYTLGSWYWMRVRISDNRISAKVWPAGDDENDGFDLAVTDAFRTIPDPGVVGIATPFAGANPDIDFFSVSISRYALPPFERVEEHADYHEYFAEFQDL